MLSSLNTTFFPVVLKPNSNLSGQLHIYDGNWTWVEGLEYRRISVCIEVLGLFHGYGWDFFFASCILCVGKETEKPIKEGYQKVSGWSSLEHMQNVSEHISEHNSDGSERRGIIREKYLKI